MAELEKDNEIRPKRSVSDVNDVNMDHNEVDSELVTEPPIEPFDDPEEKWTEKYRGADVHVIITEIEHIDYYVFRVSAWNSYGVSAYSSVSDFLNKTARAMDATGAANSERTNVLWLMVSIPISIILLGIFLVCAILSKFEAKIYSQLIRPFVRTRNFYRILFISLQLSIETDETKSFTTILFQFLTLSWQHFEILFQAST